MSVLIFAERTLAGLIVYAGLSYDPVEAHEMGEVLCYGHHVGTVQAGPWIIPKGILTLRKFPRLQIPLTLHVPVLSGLLDSSDFFIGGKLSSFSDLKSRDRRVLADDPLSQRTSIVVEVTLFYEFVREELYDFITKINEFEELGRQLGIVVANTVEGMFGSITANTALQKKDYLQPIFKERLEAVTLKEGERRWAIRLTQTLIGPITFHPDLQGAITSIGIAMAEKRRRIIAAETTKAELMLEGEGKGKALGSVAEYMESESGKLAASLEASTRIYGGAQKAIFGTGPAAAIAGMKELLASV